MSNLIEKAVPFAPHSQHQPPQEQSIGGQTYPYGQAYYGTNALTAEPIFFSDTLHTSNTAHQQHYSSPLVSEHFESSRVSSYQVFGKNNSNASQSTDYTGKCETIFSRNQKNASFLDLSTGKTVPLPTATSIVPTNGSTNCTDKRGNEPTNGDPNVINRRDNSRSNKLDNSHCRPNHLIDNKITPLLSVSSTVAASDQPVEHLPVRGQPQNCSQEAERECANCNTRSTPLWRRYGPSNFLCNACGLFHRVNGNHRPLVRNIRRVASTTKRTGKCI